MTTHYRDRTEIVTQILDIANGPEDVTKTKIMYRAFISYHQIQEYLELLSENNLLRYDSITHTYKTTAKGTRLLQLCNELEGMIKRSKPRGRKQRPSFA